MVYKDFDSGMTFQIQNITKTAIVSFYENNSHFQL